MKKKVVKVLLILLGLLLVYIGFNQLDISGPVTQYSQADFMEPVYDRSNGFFRLWSLSETDEVNIESEEVFTRYRKLWDPSFDNHKFITEFISQKPLYLQKGRQKLRKLKEKIPERGKAWTNHPINSNVHWLDKILAARDQVEIMRKELAVWLDRYQKLIDTQVYVDVTILRVDAPLPNLLAWFLTGKVYNVINMLDAVEGNWQAAVDRLLAHVNSSKRIIKGSVVLINNLIGKAVLANTLRALATLMDRKECPADVYKQILDGLPPIQYEEFGSRNSFIGEILFLSSIWELGMDGENKDIGAFARFFKYLLLQKNRTHKAHADNMTRYIEHEKIPPFQWKEPLTQPESLVSGMFWWLQNPVGKKWVDNMKLNGVAVIIRSYRVKSYYDMTRISAELHMNYTADKPVEEILSQLESYKTPDPFSGESYRWDEQKQVLYSIGINKVDDGGIENNKKYDKDFIVPCILYVK